MSMETAMEFSFWKEEPLSPDFSELEGGHQDLWELFQDEVAKQQQDTPKKCPKDARPNHGKWLPDSPGDSCDSLLDSHSMEPSTRAQLATQLLEDLDVLIKEEPFADTDWYETKTDLAMFEELASAAKDDPPGAQGRPFTAIAMSYPAFTPTPPAAVHVPLAAVQPLQQPQQPPHLQLQQHALQQHNNLQLHNLDLAAADTQTLLQEFECVFDRVEQSHGTLTPPQSPPHPSSPAPTATYHHRPAPATPLSQQLLLVPEDFTTAAMTPNPKLIEEVDEIVRSRVAESWLSSPQSPCSSSSSSSSSSAGEPASPAPLTPETDDPEWLPTPSAEDADEGRRPGKAPARGRKRGASKPYAVTVEDKRMRKKEQNKNAATRYRMKKKAEVEVILGEENGLLDTNKQLQDRVADLSQEIRYLKNLMRDVFRAKGLIK